MTSKRLMLAGILLILLVGGLTEVLLLAGSRVTLSNRAHRLIARAPAVHVNGQLLVYHGHVPVDAASLEAYKTSDEGYELWKAKGTPETPPFMFLKGADAGYFKYSKASPPWSF